MSSGKIIGVISIKGGVGKTTSVANISSAMASNFNKKVLAVDANFTAPNLGLHLGLVEPKVTLHDVLLNRANADESIYQHEGGFHVIPGAYISRKIDPFRLKQKIGCLKEHYDVIMLDSSPNINDEMLAAMIASDELLVVTSPDYPTLSTTLRAVRLARQKKTPITGLILNRARNKKYELSIADIEEAAEVPVLCVVPEDIKVPESIANTTPVTSYCPKANASVEYNKLAACLVGGKYKDPRLWSQLKSLFRKDITKDNINRLLINNGRK